MTGSTFRKTYVAVAVAVLVVAGLGVGSAASLTDSGTLAAQDGGNAQVRVAHMSPDAPPVDILVDNNVAVQDVNYGDVTGYLDLSPGNHEITVVTARNESTVLQSQISVEADQKYTVAAIGEAGENATQQLRLKVLNDATEAPSADNASVRLVHTSPDAGPVDVTVNQSGAVLFDNATFGNATDYATVPSGVYTLDVRPATADNNGSVVAMFNQSLLGGHAYTVFAAGYASPPNGTMDRELNLFVAVDVNASAPTTGMGNQTTRGTQRMSGNQTTMGGETTSSTDAETTTA